MLGTKKQYKSSEKHKKDHQLGEWVDQQCTNYRSKNPFPTTDNKIHQLESMGFLQWKSKESCQNESWTKMYERLVASCVQGGIQIHTHAFLQDIRIQTIN